MIQNPSNEKLSGYNGRWTTGGIQIICGLVEIAFGIAVIIIPLRYYKVVLDFGLGEDQSEDADGDYVGWGIWNGAVLQIQTYTFYKCIKSFQKVVGRVRL